MEQEDINKSRLCKCEVTTVDEYCRFCDGLIIQNPFAGSFELIRVLYTSEQIATRVNELGAVIDARCLRDPSPRGIVLLGALTGAYVFMSDLSRVLKTPHTIQFIRASSYHGGTETSGNVKVDSQELGKLDLVGKDIYIVEDILDTGLTYKALRVALEFHADCVARATDNWEPRSLNFCAMLSKPDKLKVEGLEIDEELIGFQLRPPRFVVGYGLDYKDHFRGLPFIAEAKEVME